MRLATVLVLCFLLWPAIGRAQRDAGATKTPLLEMCQKTRLPRVQAVQIRTKQWLARIDAMKAACPRAR